MLPKFLRRPLHHEQRPARQFPRFLAHEVLRRRWSGSRAGEGGMGHDESSWGAEGEGGDYAVEDESGRERGSKDGPVFSVVSMLADVDLAWDREAVRFGRSEKEREGVPSS